MKMLFVNLGLVKQSKLPGALPLNPTREVCSTAYEPPTARRQRADASRVMAYGHKTQSYMKNGGQQKYLIKAVYVCFIIEGLLILWIQLYFTYLVVLPYLAKSHFVPRYGGAVKTVDIRISSTISGNRWFFVNQLCIIRKFRNRSPEVFCNKGVTHSKIPVPKSSFLINLHSSVANFFIEEAQVAQVFSS